MGHRDTFGAAHSSRVKQGRREHNARLPTVWKSGATQKGSYPLDDSRTWVEAISPFDQAKVRLASFIAVAVDPTVQDVSRR